MPCTDCLSGCLCCNTGSWSTLSVRFLTAKYLYFTGFLITSVLTWVLRDHTSLWFARNAGAVSFCTEGEGKNDEELARACGGGQIAMRISFANVCFFALHVLILLGLKRENDKRLFLHTGCWGIKVLMWIGALIGFFFVPANAITGYAQFARIASSVYLVLQIILLVNFIYLINEYLVEKDNRIAWVVLALGTIVTFGLGLVLIGFSYHLYAPDPSCHRNIFFNTWSIIVGIALVGILFVPKRAPTAGLLTSGSLFLYASYLLISSLTSDHGKPECIRDGGTSPRWIQIVGFFISLAAVMYSTQSAGSSSRDMISISSSEDKEDPQLPYRADFFHLIFALASMYIAMLFSNWQVSPNFEAFELDEGTISMWVKIASKWCSEAIYIWTVVAPSIFQGRDFGYG